VKAAVGSGAHTCTADLPPELGADQRKGEFTAP
jgi:hypothetical protein